MVQYPSWVYNQYYDDTDAEYDIGGNTGSTYVEPETPYVPPTPGDEYMPTPTGPEYIPMNPVNNPVSPLPSSGGGGGQTVTPTSTQKPQTYWGDDGYEYAWDDIAGKPVRTGSYDPTKDKIRQQTEAQSERDRQVVLEQERIRAEQEKQQRLAQLRANPASWLEYASLAGQTPQVQPWMLPLMPQQYSQFQSGQNLPGWTSGGSNLSSLPDLTDPSAQYMARLNPAQREQYYGYERARTGARPEDTENVLWNQAPPSGTNQGLRWMR